MQRFSDFYENADNIYRTKDYIVKQTVGVCDKGVGGALFMSDDTYYLRTKQRDDEYEFIFKERGENIEGKRMKTSAYMRRYID